MILKPKILKNVKDVEYMDDFDDWYIFKENSSDYAEFPKNMILYGPPGTGKTYHTLLYAVAVIEEKSLSDIVNEPLEDIIKRYHHYKADGLIEFTTFHQSYSYEEFIEGIRPVMTSDSDNVISDVKYKVSSGLFKNFCDRAKQSIQTNHVFIIDEINRGNIAKIFGELITLIEPSKRIGQLEGTYTRLPYSKESFGVPDNIYIIGTMNTADRSISTIDTALRRRFQFKEMQPDPSVLSEIYVEELSIQQLLSHMNQKISVLYDREHTIGHAYFMPLKNNPTVETLASIFKSAILPLLQEYFYEDYEKIRLVLGDNKKVNESEQFIIKNVVDYDALFGSTDFDLGDSFQYLFTQPNKKFILRPDIVIIRKHDNAIFICDTKWKLLSSQKVNWGISQADMYQMYAYQKKYNAKNITMLYPMTEKVSQKIEHEKEIKFTSDDGVIVRVRFIDLFDIKKSLMGLMDL